MKKILPLVLMVIAVSIYSCQKGQSVKPATSAAMLQKVKKDTTPPPAAFKVKRDTTPPPAALRVSRDTTPPPLK